MVRNIDKLFIEDSEFNKVMKEWMWSNWIKMPQYCGSNFIKLFYYFWHLNFIYSSRIILHFSPSILKLRYVASQLILTHYHLLFYCDFTVIFWHLFILFSAVYVLSIKSIFIFTASIFIYCWIVIWIYFM